MIASGTGLAGALVIIPTLNNATRLSAGVITGTTLCSTTVLSAVGSVNYLDMGLVNVPAVLLLSTSGIATTFLGAAAARKVGRSRFADLLKPGLGLVLLGLAPNVLKRGEGRGEGEGGGGATELMERRKDEGFIDYTMNQFRDFDRSNVMGLAGFGAVGGFTQGFAALGGGLIQVRRIMGAVAVLYILCTFSRTYRLPTCQASARISASTPLWRQAWRLRLL